MKPVRRGLWVVPPQGWLSRGQRSSLLWSLSSEAVARSPPSHAPLMTSALAACVASRPATLCLKRPPSRNRRSKVQRCTGVWRRVHQQCPVSWRRLPWKRKMERTVSLKSLRVRQTQNKWCQKNVTSRRRSFLVAVLCADGVSVSRQHDGRPYCHKPCYAALFGPKGKLHPLPVYILT